MNKYRNWTDEFDLDKDEDLPCVLKKTNSFTRMKEDLAITRQESSGILLQQVDDPLDIKTKIPSLYSNWGRPQSTNFMRQSTNQSNERENIFPSNTSSVAEPSYIMTPAKQYIQQSNETGINPASPTFKQNKNFESFTPKNYFSDQEI